MDNQAIFESVRDCLADSLSHPAASITRESRLIDELGADSLDFVDIIFTLERRFGVKLRTPELDRVLRAEFAEGTLVEDKYIPAADIERMRAWLPALDAAPDRARITPAQLFSYVTVEFLVRVVDNALRQAPSA